MSIQTVIDVPPPPEPPRWPVSYAGIWRRDWRLGREFVDTGIFQIKADGVWLTARRTNPLRALIYFALRISLWTVGAAVLAAVLLTAIGLSWRNGSVCWLLTFPIVAIPIALPAMWLVRRVARAFLEPSVSAPLRWEQVTSITSDGHEVELRIETPGLGAVHGRFVPRRLSPEQRKGLLAIRDGLLPGGFGRQGSFWSRPWWVDRAIGVGAVATALALGVVLEPIVSDGMMRWGSPRHGPAAGIPDDLSPSQLEALAPSRCVAAPPGPRIHNAVDGTALTWRIEGDGAAWSVGLLRLPAGGSKLELPGIYTASDARLDPAVTPSVAAITVTVPTDQRRAFEALARQGTADALDAAFCSGLVGALDVTIAPRGAVPTLALRRDGNDLVVTAQGLTTDAWLLPVRWHDTPSPDLLDPCEVPQVDGLVPRIPATARPHTLRGFFHGDDERARVYLVPTGAAADVALETLGRGGTFQRCLSPDSLYWTGVATTRALFAPETASLDLDTLRNRAAARARQAAALPVGMSADGLVDALRDRYQTVQADLGRGLSVREQEAVTTGFLDAVPWSQVIDTVSMSESIPRIEMLRQRLDGTDPTGQAGRQFLIALGEAFMDRVAIGRAYSQRIALGERWMAIRPGPIGSVNGTEVRVPDDHVAEGYQIVGRYLVLDTARHLEDDINEDRLGTWDSIAATVPTLDLQLNHKMSITVRQGTKSKIFWAWVRGDFEYLIGKVFQKTLGRALASNAVPKGLRLDTTYSNRDVRVSTLVDGFDRSGRVFQFDATRVTLAYGPNRFVERGAPRGTLLAMSGAYVDGLDCTGRPAGFSASGGRVDNYLTAPDKGGLVALGATPGVRVLDIRRGGRLPGDTREVRPLVGLGDYAQLLGWVSQRSGSAFQTHALFANGEPRIDEGRADAETAPRRLLVDAAYKDKSGAPHPIVAVVDLPMPQTLFHAMQVARGALEAPDPGLEVIGIANLDTGACNVGSAWTPEGGDLWHTDLPLARAQNLVTISVAP